MEKSRKLYPMKFTPIEISHSWGTEYMMLADLGIEDSVVESGWLSENSIGDIMETYLERVVGEDTYNYFGRQFPVTVKILDINGEMPVRVHPDDEVAGQRYDALGGKEFWYITDAGKDSRIYAGFSRDVTAQELYDRCRDGSIKDVMNTLHPSKDGFLTVYPGTVHSAGHGLRIAVIKEASELPFTLSGDDGTDATGHLAEALDFIALEKSAAAVLSEGEKDGLYEKLSCGPEFNISRISLSAPVRSQAGDGSSYIIYMCIAGAASIQVPAAGPEGKKKTDNYQLGKGEMLLIPAEVQEFYLIPAERDTMLLEITPGRHDDTDGYINPDTEPFLEGEDYEGLEDENDEENGIVPEQDGDMIREKSPRGKHDMDWK